MYSSLFSKTMCQVVAYRRLKTIENSKTVSRRLREVLVYERFQYKALTENMFGVLRRCSLWEVVAYERWFLLPKKLRYLH